MRQLSGLDASFLNMESPTTFGHVSGLMILDPSEVRGRFDRTRVKALIEQRLHLLPPFRWRLVEVPFGLDQPYWVEDPNFDLDFHVRELGLPPPGDRQQLADQVSRIIARPLDRSHPLWELYVIGGLEEGRVAVLTKMHHAAVDGVSGMEILTTLLDTTPEPAEVPPPAQPWQPEPIPGTAEMVGRGYWGLLRQPGKVLRMQQRMLTSATRFGRDADGLRVVGRRDNPLLTPAPRPAPRTPFNRSITASRRFAFSSLSLDDAKAVKNAYGATVNDVVLAICAGALRRWLIDHDALPAEPLLAMVPVSVRSGEQQGTFGNRVSLIIVPLPTDQADPGTRLERVHEEMKGAKERFKALPADLMQDFSQFATPALAALAARSLARLRVADVVNPPFNLVVSNVPGPSYPLYLAGARLVAQYPVSAVADGQGLNMTVLSYQGTLDFGLVSCRELVPDLWNLMDYVGDALDELVTVARGRAR